MCSPTEQCCEPFTCNYIWGRCHVFPEGPTEAPQRSHAQRHPLARRPPTRNYFDPGVYMYASRARTWISFEAFPTTFLLNSAQGNNRNNNNTCMPETCFCFIILRGFASMLRRLTSSDAVFRLLSRTHFSTDARSCTNQPRYFPRLPQQHIPFFLKTHDKQQTTHIYTYLPRWRSYACPDLSGSRGCFHASAGQVQVWPTAAKFGPTEATVGSTWSDLANFGRLRPRFARFWPTSGRLCPTFTKRGQHWPMLCRRSAKCAQRRSSLAGLVANLVKLGPFLPSGSNCSGFRIG